MREIIIDGITMPQTRTLEIGGEYEAKTETMASGKVVKDLIGWRTTLTATWEYVPAETLTAVIAKARNGHFLKIKYPDSDGSTPERLFSIDIGNQKIFRFIGDKPYWYNVELTATAQETIP